MTGKIIKGIAGFYYVHIKDYGIYECKAKGKFRNNKIKPLVGDNVEVDILDSLEKKGNIVKILSRENDLIRPLVANKTLYPALLYVFFNSSMNFSFPMSILLKQIIVSIF